MSTPIQRYRPLIAIVLVALIGTGVWWSGAHQFLTLDTLKTQADALGAAVTANPWQAAGLFFLTYVLVAALSIPGAAVMTLASGALFGLIEGTVLVSFASSIGATLAFLVARFGFRDALRAKFGDWLRDIDAGIARDGAVYLLTLRLVPAFPFFLVNLLSGLTSLPTRTFYWVSQLGMLPATIVYVLAGTQLAQIRSLGDVLSPGLLGALVALGALPLLLKAVLGWLKARRVYAGHRKPKSFDYNLIAIGAGSAGLVTTYIGAAVKAKVALIEKHKMGG
ncbi:MAG: VTT domain-containing protein, partial [Lysobacteraceae bacterium]